MVQGLQKPINKVNAMFQKLKSALFRGLLILLPILFLIIIIDEFIGLMIGLATPIADLLLPPEVIDSIPETELLALLLIVLGAMTAGLLAMIPPINTLGNYFETRVLDKIPVYKPLRTLLHALLGSEDTEAFKPALLASGDGAVDPVYIVEDHGKSHVVVLLPWSPASFAGSLKFVPRTKVYPLELSFDEFSLAIGHFGVGLLDKVPDVPEHLKRAENTPDDSASPGGVP